MGILDGILRVIGVKGKEVEAPDLNKTPPLKKSFATRPGNSRSNPNQNTEWFKRSNRCPGSGQPAVNLEPNPSKKYTWGTCPVCLRTRRRVTSKGNTWHHKGREVVNE